MHERAADYNIFVPRLASHDAAFGYGRQKMPPIRLRKYRGCGYLDTPHGSKRQGNVLKNAPG